MKLLTQNDINMFTDLVCIVRRVVLRKTINFVVKMSKNTIENMFN